MGYEVNWQAVTGVGACLTALFGGLTAWGTWTRTWIAVKEYKWRIINVHNEE